MFPRKWYGFCLITMVLKADDPKLALSFLPGTDSCDCDWKNQYSPGQANDKSRFSFDFADKRKRVWHWKNERNARCCIAEHDIFVGWSVMVWVPYVGTQNRVYGSVNCSQHKFNRLFSEIAWSVVNRTLLGHSCNKQEQFMTSLLWGQLGRHFK